MFGRSFNKTKAINSLILIAQKIADDKGEADVYAALKILYFAELKHIAKYGRFITDDLIAPLEHGSVPSSSYDLLKKQNNEPSFEIITKISFKPKVDFNSKELSESEIECILESVNENKGKSFPELKKKAHDEAYEMAKSTNKSFVPLEYILKQEKLSQEQIDFIKEHYDFIESVQWLNL